MIDHPPPPPKTEVARKAIDDLIREMQSGARRCDKCNGVMYHSRLKGYQCLRCK